MTTSLFKAILPTLFLMLINSNLGLANSWSFSGPLLSFDSQAGIRVEKNLNNVATLTFEGVYQSRDERLSEKDMEQSGEDSLVTSGREYMLLVSRYSQPQRLAGFFWSLGAGYRSLDADWHTTPDEELLNLYQDNLDENGKATHRVRLNGVTGHGRMGYRYVGNNWPILIGVQLGLRHFQGGLEDDEEVDGRELSNEQEDKIRRRFTTTLIPSVDVGFVF